MINSISNLLREFSTITFSSIQNISDLLQLYKCIPSLKACLDLNFWDKFRIKLILPDIWIVSNNSVTYQSSESSDFITNCDGVMLEIYLDHKLRWLQEGFNCQSLAYEVVNLMQRHEALWPKGLGNFFVCKRLAVQTLQCSLEFVIQISSTTPSLAQCILNKGSMHLQ